MSVSDDEAHPQWNPALELVIKKEGEQAQGLYWLHNHASDWAKRRDDWIQLPAICLATITGFLSATSELLPPVAIGALSVGVGILNTVNSYFKFAQRAEGHRISSLWYLKTYKEIETQLSIPISQRASAEAMLKQLREDLQRVSQTAPPIPEATIAAFKAKFPEPDLAVPIIANGLDPITVLERGVASPRAPAPSPLPPLPPRPDIRISVV
jgi:hypothetical protein